MGTFDRKGSPPPSEGTAGLRGALLPGALLGPDRDGAPPQVAQRRELSEERAGQGADLAVGADSRTGGESREGQAVLVEEAGLPPLGEHLMTAAAAHVVRPPLDGEGAHVRIAEH